MTTTIILVQIFSPDGKTLVGYEAWCDGWGSEVYATAEEAIKAVDEHLAMLN